MVPFLVAWELSCDMVRTKLEMYGLGSGEEGRTGESVKAS